MPSLAAPIILTHITLTLKLIESLHLGLDITNFGTAMS